MPVHELEALRDRSRVFRDRAHAGHVLGEMLSAHRGSDALVLAIPAGGLPVAGPLARLLELTLDVAVVSKITLPWNSEVGYGAVAFDGTVRLNERLLSGLELSDDEVRLGIEATSEKVRRRARALRGSDDPPEVGGREVLLVDDGLASGFTMLAAAESLREAGARNVVVAVPTGSPRALDGLGGVVETLYCANVRYGSSFAVADAYEDWSDVTEAQALDILRRART
jgi:predicted phosphoribosyltransferase